MASAKRCSGWIKRGALGSLCSALIAASLPTGAAPAVSAGVSGKAVEILAAEAMAHRSAAAPAPVAAPAAVQSRVQRGYGRLPMHFEPNVGQSAEAVRFTARGPGYRVLLAPQEAVLMLHADRSAQTGAVSAEPQTATSLVRMRLEGAERAAAPTLEGLDPLPGYSNYFIGKDPARWRTRVPHYAKVKYAGVYPGIDLVYYGNPQQLEYDFVLSPGADPSRIQLAFEGAEQVRVAANGDLILTVPGGELVQQAPRLWQEIDGKRRAVEGHYVLRSTDSEQVALQPGAPSRSVRVGFQVAHYRSDQPLVIDPVLTYGTYLGGNSIDDGQAIAVDGGGNAYVTGSTYSSDFPTTADALAPNKHGDRDAFVAKLNADGTDLIYATYLGGSGYSDVGQAIAVDGAGNAYVTGYTESSDFPASADAAYPTTHGQGDAFVVKLTADGTDLVYGTYLGGTSYDQGRGIAVDRTGNAYATGSTDSTDFPTTIDSAYPSGGNSLHSFVAKLNASGTSLVYGSYLGGNGGRGIAVDSAGNAYVTGTTYCWNFPASHALQPTCGGGSYDAFVSKIASDGSALVYWTYLGGSEGDQGFSIAVDDQGQAYVTGSTTSSNFPTRNAMQSVYSGGYGSNGKLTDAFVAKIDASGSALVYSTYLGAGSGDDSGNGIALDATGIVYLVGTTDSSAFPVRDSLVSGLQGAQDAFVAALSPNGRGLLYSTYLGGSGSDSGNGIAVDAAGNAYVTGETRSSDFPITPGAFASQWPGYTWTSNAFVSRIALGGDPLLISPVGAGSGTVYSTVPDARIDCGNACAAILPAGTPVRLAAAASGLSVFSAWSGACAAAGANTTCNLTMAGTRSVAARFEPRTDNAAIGQVLDLTGATWSTAGDAAWFAQDRATHDGSDAAQSGAIGDNRSTGLSTAIVGPGYLSFWWKVSAEDGWDYLTFALDGVERAAITGDTAWARVELFVPAGNHTLTWAYEKDAQGAGGQDAGWLDQVIFDSAARPLTIDPPVGGTVTGGEAGSYPPGTAVTLTASAASGFYFGGWGGDCLAAGRQPTCVLTMDTDKRVSAGFVPVPPLLPVLQGAATRIAAGDGYSCAVADGGVRCWGNNGSGQLGDGTVESSAIPVQTLPAGSGATAVATGRSHACAVVSGGVQCWGGNGGGQLGNGSTASSRVPVQTLPAGSGATAIVAGESHSCAVVSGGVKCWGNNSNGQFGNGSTNSSPVPVQTIASGKGVTAIAASGYHTCAVAEGGVKCWGANWYGQLGNGTTVSSLVPVQSLPAGSGATDIAVGGYGGFTCAIAAGGVKCWGANDSGQLGNGTTVSSLVPLQTIPAGSGASAIAAYGGASDSHACAVVGGGVKCWGGNNGGQLGNGTTQQSPVPVQAIPAGSGATAIAAGAVHSCAVIGGGVECWGGNDQGQLGDGTQTSRPTPVWTSGLERKAYADTLSLQVQGPGRVSFDPPGIDCSGQCAANYDAPTPVRLVATPSSFGAFVAWDGACAAAGANTTCNLTVDGQTTVSARFANDSGAMAQVLDLPGATWSTAGDAAWFAQNRVTHDGTDAAQSGAIGDNQSARLSTAIAGPGYLSFWWKVSSEDGWDYLTLALDGVEQAAITGETDWVQAGVFVPAGTHTLVWAYEKDASDAGGEDAAWLDQVTFDTSDRTLTIDPPAGGTVTGNEAGSYPPGTAVTLTASAASGFYFGRWGGDCLAAGREPTCVLTMDTDKRVSAGFVPVLQGATTRIAAGYGYSCAVADGGVRCWGNNDAGQLGDGTVESSAIPVQTLPAGSGATAVATGGSHACAVVGGGVQCWGSNYSGQLGNGTTESSRLPVQTLPAGSGATAIAAGSSHSCAVVSGGVKCWGSSYSGQLGNGSTSSSLVPVQTIAPTKKATAIAASDSHTCAVIAGGVKCWGANGSGQLGNGKSVSSLTPVQAIPASSGVTAIAANIDRQTGSFDYDGYTCAVVAGGVKCWGSNRFGQLGNGKTVQSLVPVQTLAAGSGATAIAAGGEEHGNAYACAVVGDGVKCWGGNGAGQFGNGTTNSSLIPVQTIPAGSSVTAIAAGAYHSCAVIAGGAKCWGSNEYGQLGDGTETASLVPKSVIGLISLIDRYRLTVGMAGNGSGSVASLPAGIDCGQTCGADFDSGTRVELSATATAGSSVFTGWSGAGCTGTGSCAVTMDAAKSVTANFALKTYAVAGTANPPAAGAVTCTPNPVDHGGTVTCTATIGAGYGFSNWSGDCAGQSGTSCVLTNVVAPKSATANFVSLVNYTLTAKKTGTGTVTSDPAGINCGSVCSASFASGASVALTATPEAGYRFSSWSGCTSVSGAVCTATMSAAKTVTANFVALPKYTLTARKTGTGTVTSDPAGINCGSVCSASFASGTSVALTATPGAGYRFSSWSGCTSVSGTVCTATMSAAKTVTANFALIPTSVLTLSKTGYSYGTVTSTPTGINCGKSCASARASFEQGTSVTLTATAIEGRTFKSWSGACSGTVDTCTIPMTGAKSVVAVFQ